MKTVYIGKSLENDIVIQDDFVSRRHLRISQQSNGEYLLEDLGSTNGTFVNGNRVQTKVLSSNDIVKIGNTILPWQNYFLPTAPQNFPQKTPLMSIRIGRSPNNDFVIANPTVSQQHAILQVFPNEQFVLIDVGSTNGTFLNGRKIEKSWVSANSEVQFGNEKVFIRHILQSSTIAKKSPTTSTPKGKSSTAPSKYLKKNTARKSPSLPSFTWIILLILMAYGGISYLKSKNENNLKKKLEQEKPTKEETDDLADYDDEGRLIEKKENTQKTENTEENKQIEQDKQDDQIPKTDTKSLEDIVEDAENAIFRIDALEQGISKGFGTGFFVNSSGVGVSNYHVLSPGSQWQIKLKNGEVYEVTEVLESNKDLDYVIFTTNAQNVSFLPIASQLPRKGQDIFVIGNPQGFEFSVTKGIVSGIRNYNSSEGIVSEGDDYIQIDAPISSGNSGGPVFNMNGEVVGITTMVINGKSGIAQNLNLAINIQKLNIPFYFKQ